MVNPLVFDHPSFNITRRQAMPFLIGSSRRMRCAVRRPVQFNRVPAEQGHPDRVGDVTGNYYFERLSKQNQSADGEN